MTRFASLLPVMALLLVGESGPCHGQGLSSAGPRPPLYEEKGSLQKALLATRQRYSAWLAEQPLARKAVVLTPWLVTPLLPSAEVDERVRPADGIEPAARLADGRKLWSARENLADNRVVAFVTGSASDAIYLARTIRVQRPTRLTVGIGGGDRLDVWLGGRKVASAKTHLNSGRYGCATRVDGTRVDQLLVDLDLSTGENILLIRLTPEAEPSFYFSTTPNWHHLVLVCDARRGGRATFHVDGRIAGEEHLGVGIRLDLYGFRIGGWDRWEDKPANSFHGAIDDVRIYSGMLTDKQAAGLAEQR